MSYLIGTMALIVEIGQVSDPLSDSVMLNWYVGNSLAKFRIEIGVTGCDRYIASDNRTYVGNSSIEVLSQIIDLL